jgi:hypothetical protein
MAWVALGLAGAAAAALAVGCGGNSKVSGVGSATLPQDAHVEKIDHEACDEAGHRVETMDANGDGKPDVSRVYDKTSGKELCRITDLDRDGKPDMFEYYDSNGDMRRREADYDTTGVINAIELFDHGKLVLRELDTTGQHRIDTWDYFDPASGKRTHRERDSTNDGKVDQWWTWDGDKVTISMDRNGDGKPDPDDTVTIGGDQPQGPAGATSPADAGAPPPDAAVPDAAPPATTPVATSTDLVVDAGPPPAPDGGAPSKKHGGKSK